MMKVVFLTSSLIGTFAIDCPAGYKHKTTSLAADICGKKDATSTSCQSGCCMKDPLKCGGQATVACAADKYWDSTKAGTDTTVAAAPTTCCATKATCATSTATCPAGYKAKTSAKDTKCTGTASDCSFNTCCEKDDKTCGGLVPFLCASGFAMSYGATTATTEAWMKKAATATNQATNCCQAKATCATTGLSCATRPGYMIDTTKVTAKTECTGQTSSYKTDYCPSTCCKKDVAKCANWLATAGCDTATHYADTAKADTAATTANKKTQCCTEKAKCAVAVCGAGYKMKASVATTVCTSDAASCAGSTCCEKDTAKCGGLESIVCPATSYNECAGSKPSSTTLVAWMACLNKVSKEADKNKLTTAGGCCTAKGTCAAFKAAVATSALVSKTAAQLLPGAFLIVVLAAFGAV